MNLKTFEEFLNEARQNHKNIRLPNGWVLQLQPHFEERYRERDGNVPLDKFFDMIYKVVSKWDANDKRYDRKGGMNWDKHEIAFLHVKTGTKATFNVHLPKKQLRTITYLEPDMEFKQGDRIIRLREGEYEFIDASLISESMEVIEIVEVFDDEDLEDNDNQDE